MVKGKKRSGVGFVLALFTIVFVAAVSIVQLSAGESQFSITHSIQFSAENLVFSKLNDFDMVKLSGHSYINQPGEPMLPQRIIKIALPDGMTAEAVRVVDYRSIEIDGQYNIFPAQPPIPIGTQDEIREFVKADKKIYNSSEPYPTEIVRLVGQGDLAGQSFAVIAIAPVQYIPADKKLKLFSSISFVIEGRDGYICGDYLPERLSSKESKNYQRRLEFMIDNHEEVALRLAPAGMKFSSSLPDGGPYEHVIITSESQSGFYQPLADWHTRKGVRDIIITTAFINSNYAGGDDKERIRNFIIDAHQNWGTMYYLLGGEQSTVPFAYREYSGEIIPSDAYYADYDDDWEYEVYLGRITTEGASEVERFINKVIRYETDPPWLGYGNRVALVGMDLTGSWEAPYYTLTRGQFLKDSIAINVVPGNIIVKEIYDTSPGNHQDEFMTALNEGVNLVNHCDHSNYNVMGVGSINHGWHMTSWDVYDLTNYNKYCIIYSLGCHTNRMDINDAISEVFVFGTDSTGAVAFTGNTRNGWFYVGDPMSLSSELDFYWWVGLYEYNQYRLGEALAFAKSATNIDVVHPYSDWTLNLLGEPEMPVWKAGAFPDYLSATHTTELEALPSVYDVHVTKTGGANVENAFVCLWKGDEIYLRGYTDANGDISFDIYPTTLGEMYVTVTKQDHIPYLGQATITGNVPPVCITPADTLFFQCSPEEVSLAVGCFDDDGNLASGPQLTKGPGQIISGYWYYTPTDDDSVAVTIHCEDSLGYFCETTFIVLFDINNAPVCLLPNDTLISQIAPPVEIVLPVAVDDANGNVGECLILSGPGEIIDGQWCYTPVNDETIDVLMQFTDDCDADCQDGFQITYEVMACGDPNGDLIVNIFDITYLIGFLYKDGAAPQPLAAGDADGDGATNIFDATYLISHLYKNGPTPVCP